MSILPWPKSLNMSIRSFSASRADTRTCLLLHLDLAWRVHGSGTSWQKKSRIVSPEDEANWQMLSHVAGVVTISSRNPAMHYSPKKLRAFIWGFVRLCSSIGCVWVALASNRRRAEFIYAEASNGRRTYSSAVKEKFELFQRRVA